MKNEFIENMKTNGQAVYSAIQTLGEINTKIAKDVTQLHLNFASYCVDKSIEWGQLTLEKEAANYMDLLDKKVDLTDQYSAKIAEFGEQAIDIMTDSRNEAIAWFEKNAAEMKGKAKSTAKAPTKK